MATDEHEMRMIDGRIVAVYTDRDGDCYVIRDGERHYIEVTQNDTGERHYGLLPD